MNKKTVAQLLLGLVALLIAITIFTIETNFGNPSFSISSSQADDAGYGNFEYDVPAGFYSWNTKNLAKHG